MSDNDIINNEIFKQFGLSNGSNCWLFYDERFLNFFGYSAQHISDVNILTDVEVLEKEDLQQRGQYWDDNKRGAKLRQLEHEHRGLLDGSETKVAYQSKKIALLAERASTYADMLDVLRAEKNASNNRLSGLERQCVSLAQTEKELLTASQNKAKKLEELQRENSKLYVESAKCFTKVQSPPLFLHQLPLEQYFLKCDSFLQYFNMYMKQHFKIEEYLELHNNSSGTEEIIIKLGKLDRNLQHHTMQLLSEQAKMKATQALIELLKVSHVHSFRLADIQRETRELELLRIHHLQNVHEALLSDLRLQVQQHTNQRMEQILYENTKVKLERAQQRCTNTQRLLRMISNALSNAELVWIGIQLDLERKNKRVDHTDQLHSEAQNCMQRVSAMRSAHAAWTRRDGDSGAFVEEIAAMLSNHLQQHVRTESKACLYEYEKFNRLLAYAQQSMLQQKPHKAHVEQLNELSRMADMLQPFIYDSPVRRPMVEDMRFLLPIAEVKTMQACIVQKLRSLRTKFHENITQRLEKDHLWRYSRLLWIWFLTEPKRVLVAIETAKKAAAKVPPISGVKALGGIKRM